MKRHFKEFAEDLKRGASRFAPFNAGAVLLASFLVWHNHIPWEKRGTAGLLPLSLARGVCWGMLAALAMRLALERRKVRPPVADIVPAAAGIAVSAAGSWFWLLMRGGNAFPSDWGMLHLSGVAALTSSAVFFLFGDRNGTTLFGQLFQSAVFVGMISLAAMLGGLLCFAAYDELIARIRGDIFDDVAVIIWCAVAPIFMAATLPRDDAPAERSRWQDTLFRFLAPLGLALLAILYAYIAKIIVRWEMPSGKINWFASFAMAGYLFLWLSLRRSRVRFFAFVARWGWAALLPVVATQIVGIAIRYQAHGLTTPRMAGMATLAIGIYALVLAAFDREPGSLFAVAAIAGIVATVSPLNIVDVPLREQSARLHRVLEGNGCLDAAGRLSVPEDPDIPLSDAKKLVGAAKYLANLYSFKYYSKTNAPTVRSGVWYRPRFAQSVLEGTAAIRRDWNLPALLKIDESKLASAERSGHITTHWFQFEAWDELDISGFTGLRGLKSYVLDFDSEDGRCRIKVETATHGGDSTEKTPFDVTDYIDRIIDESGARLKWENGEWNNGYRIFPELALWRLSENLALAITDLTIKVSPSHPKTLSGSVTGILLIKK